LKDIIIYQTTQIGTSSLYNGERRDKDDEIFEALGWLCLLHKV
jgi:hypothetical protein